tara:strand:- start:16309 stop:16920 length:612 start_codon:yes stop_codon:yes gene_type:complete
MLVVILLCLVLTNANNCDTVVRGDFLASGVEKVVYEAKLGDMDVVIKETHVDSWFSLVHRFDTYSRLYHEYKVLQSFEVDYPTAMKVYDFCALDKPFYIMERGESITQDKIHRVPLQRMIQRNLNASVQIVSSDIAWEQLVKKGDEIYTIDVNMREVHEDIKIDLEEYYKMYIWQLYCFSPLPLNEERTIWCDAYVQHKYTYK